MGQEGKVVVSVRCAIQKDEEDNSFVAHFVGLGLIARGGTDEEAVRRCKQLFNKFVHAYRSVGQLEMRLDQAKVEWCWWDQYPEDRPEPEDTNALVAARSATVLREFQATYDHFYKTVKEAREQEKELELAELVAVAA